MKSKNDLYHLFVSAAYENELRRWGSSGAVSMKPSAIRRLDKLQRYRELTRYPSSNFGMITMFAEHGPDVHHEVHELWLVKNTEPTGEIKFPVYFKGINETFQEGLRKGEFSNIKTLPPDGYFNKSTGETMECYGFPYIANLSTMYKTNTGH